MALSVKKLNCSNRGIAMAAAALSVLFCITPVHGQTLKVGFFDLAPHVIGASETNSEASGPAVDYLRSIMERVGVSLAIAPTPVPLGRLISDLDTDKLQVILALAKNPEREKILHYPARPYYTMPQVLTVRKDSPLTAIASIDDLKSVKIGVYADGMLTRSLRDPNVSLDPIKGDSIVQRNLQKMIAGRLDAVYSADAFEVRYHAGKSKVAAQVREVTLPDPAIGLYTVFSRSVPDAIVKKYEAELDKSEPYERVLARFVEQGS